METILSSPVSRTHLCLGKFLLVLTASLITASLLMVSGGGSTTVVQKIACAGSDGGRGEAPPQLMRPGGDRFGIIMAVP